MKVFLDFSAFFWYVVYMNIKEVQEKIARSLQRVSDWKAFRQSPENQMGAAYVDSQLKWEFDRLERLQARLNELAKQDTVYAGSQIVQENS